MDKYEKESLVKESPQHPHSDEDDDDEDDEEDEDETDSLEGRESELAEVDKGELPDLLRREEVTEVFPQPEYYPPQIHIAEKVVERIEVIYKVYHNKNLSCFKKFDFVIYTANINMLQDQTRSRLSRRESGCFPEEVYEDSDIKARKMAKERIHKYNRGTIASYNDFCARVTKEKDTLFLVVADEAHWGATEKGKPHDTLINTWNEEDHPNVIVLLVTATPYNLLTENSRLPVAYYDPSSCDADKPNVKSKEKWAAIPKGYKHLHRVRWTECFDAKIKAGRVVRLCIPLPNKIFQLYIDRPQNDTDFLSWKGDVPGHFIPYEEEFLMLDEGGKVNITTTDQKWIFIVRGDRCGFVCLAKRNENDISSFQMHHNYGESLILLGIPGINNRERLLYLKPGNTRQISIRQKRFKCDDDYEVPDLEETFLIGQCRPQASLVPTKEYISLNHYFNSMRNEKIDDQLIREDSDGMLTKILRTSSGDVKSDDILAAEYSYYIILISMIREYPMDISFIKNNFENFLQCIQEYHKQCTLCMNKFKEELRNKRTTAMHTIQELAFNRLLTFIATEVKEEIKNNFESYLDDFKTNSTENSALKLFSSIVLSLLHSVSIDWSDIKGYLGEIERKLKRESMNKKLSEMCERNSDIFSVENTLEKMLKSETGRIVNRVIPKSLDNLDGCMVIFRTDTCDSGNKVYNTLCIARKVSSKVNYTFEILRDYWKFKLSADFDVKFEAKTEVDRDSRCRIRERLQPKKCTYVNPKTLQSCPCFYRSHETLKLSVPSMECERCHHVHKRIESYEDLDKLPCILILVYKGRLGDTFPHSLKAVDSRLCYTKKSGLFNLSSVVQEMGRMCRYQIKSHQQSLPHALIGKHLGNTLRNSLIKGAPFHSLLKLPNVKPDRKTVRRKQKTEGGNMAESERYSVVASQKHSDFNNTTKHKNRILLAAEPQIGKTGVYLRVISMLRTRLTPEESDESEQDDDKDDDDDDSNRDDITYWQYPHWSDFDGPCLRKEVQVNKYAQIYGRYEHGKAPAVYMPMNITTKTKKRTSEKKQNTKSGNIMQSYNLREHACTECLTPYEHELLEFSLPCKIMGSEDNVIVDFKASIPLSARFSGLCSLIEEKSIADSSSHNKFNQKVTFIKDKHIVIRKSLNIEEPQMLNSWIFIPTYNRSDKAKVNLHHTMMTNKNGTLQQCSYTSVLVVRRTDFEQYYKRWQSAHAILQIPDFLPGVERDVYNGGIGFARLSIQIFAEALGLKWIFMMDDNIRYVKEVEFIHEKVKRENDELVEKKVLLFDVLKHIEQQVDGSIENIPENDLCRYSDINPDMNTERLEEYTGPKEKYGVIGIKSNSKYIRKVKKPFRKTHVSALVFLNIESVKKQGIQYKPWPVYEDLTLNNDCDDKGLWTCKYNRFTFWKQYMRTWLPYVYIWDEHSDLEKSLQDSICVQNSDDILINYIRCAFVIKSIYKPTYSNSRESEEDFETILKNIKLKVKDGTHVLIASRRIFFLEFTLTQQISSEEDINIIILTSSELCIENRLTTKQLIQQWLHNIVPYEYSCEVLTSHNVNKFIVKNILITLKVMVPGNQRGEMLDSMPSTSGKRPCEDEPLERNSKILKRNGNGAMASTSANVEIPFASSATTTTASAVSITIATTASAVSDTIATTASAVSNTIATTAAASNTIANTTTAVEAGDTTTMTSLRPIASSRINTELPTKNNFILFDGSMIECDRHLTLFAYFSVQHKEKYSGLLQNLMNIALNSNKACIFGDIRLVKRNDCRLPRDVIMLPPYNSEIYDSDETTNLCCQILHSICNNRINGEVGLGFLFKSESGQKGIPCKASEVTENTRVGTTFIIPDDNTQLEYSPWIDSNGIRGPRILTKGEWDKSSWNCEIGDVRLDKVKDENTILDRPTTSVAVKEEKDANIGSQTNKPSGTNDVQMIELSSDEEN